MMDTELLSPLAIATIWCLIMMSMDEESEFISLSSYFLCIYFTVY